MRAAAHAVPRGMRDQPPLPLQVQSYCIAELEPDDHRHYASRRVRNTLAAAGVRVGRIPDARAHRCACTVACPWRVWATDARAALPHVSQQLSCRKWKRLRDLAHHAWDRAHLSSSATRDVLLVVCFGLWCFVLVLVRLMVPQEVPTRHFLPACMFIHVHFSVFRSAVTRASLQHVARTVGVL